MEQKFIEMAKVIFTSIDHYRESGRDDRFNIDSIAEYLQRQFLLQQTDCYAALELLEQMLKEEQEAFGEPYFITDEVQKRIDKMNAIRPVIKMIKERQANAV